MSEKLFGGKTYDNSSIDSQFAETDDIKFLEACIECDDDSLYDIIQDGVTSEEVNERDRSGRTGLSHACANGFMPILELLESVEDVDVNLSDNDGNTPLIFAAQAGHDDVVNFLLRHFRQIKIDQCNNLGFTALMKAAIQGRTRCAKLLLFAGANPNRRDSGRKLCAEQWARFCGRHSCADAIAKYIRSKKYFFTKTFLLSRDKWNSEPDLASPKSKTRDSGGWIQRHLSMKRKKPARQKDRPSAASLHIELSTSTARTGSAPMLVMGSPGTDAGSGQMYRRPSGSMSVLPRIRVTVDMLHEDEMSSHCVGSNTNPLISETDFDKEQEEGR